MTIARGNRKLAAQAMTLAALVVGVPLLTWLKAGTEIVAAFCLTVGGAHGGTVWGNVATHRAKSEDGPETP